MPLECAAVMQMCSAAGRWWEGAGRAGVGELQVAHSTHCEGRGEGRQAGRQAAYGAHEMRSLQARRRTSHECAPLLRSAHLERVEVPALLGQQVVHLIDVQAPAGCGTMALVGPRKRKRQHAVVIVQPPLPSTGYDVSPCVSHRFAAARVALKATTLISGAPTISSPSICWTPAMNC